ncbi:MAG: RHS repeat domain-containing protein, partial [Pirellulales bacterium]
MLLPLPKTAKSPAKKLIEFVASANARLRSLFITRPGRRHAAKVLFCHHSLSGLQPLEARIVLSGNPVANNDSYVIPYYAGAQVSSPGVLANDTDPNMGATLYAQLVSGPSHSMSFQLNQDGSFHYATYNTFLGTDSFTYDVRDSFGYVSNVATVTLNVEYSVSSTTDLTKQVAIDPVTTSLQVLSDPFDASVTSPLPAGGSGGTVISATPADGAPATAHNLSLAYNSVAAQPDAVIQGLFQFTTMTAINDTVTGTLTFNGTNQPASYVNLEGMNGTSPDVDLSYQVSTANLPTGRYPYTLTLNGNYMSAPATISGAINVVNEQSSAFGAGWEMPGLDQLYQNNVSGVPAGVLLTDGTGDGWYFTGSGPSYTSPAGPYAYDTLSAVNGGGWQLVTHQGVNLNFDANGYLLSRVERTGETTTYNRANGLLTSIADQFGRAVDLSYANGELSGISDYASSTWQVAHNGALLTSITEPDPGGGSPVWQYGYNANYLSTVQNPNGNLTTYVMDSHDRLSAVDLPGGASTADTSEQSMAYGGPTQSGAPYATPSPNVDTTSKDADGNQSTAQSDLFGDPLVEVDPYNNQTSIARNANGQPTQITLPPPASGYQTPVTTINYDGTGDVASATGAQPSYGAFTYTADSFGQWATFTDTTGKEWVRTFDSKGDILTETDPGVAEVSWTYDTYGHPLTMTMPAPNNGSGTVTVSYHYDSDERLTEIVWPDNSNEQFGFNADDRETSYQDENGHSTATGVDVLGRVVSVTNAAAGITSTTYDKDGNVISTEDAMGNVTSEEWNSRNELVQETLPPAATGDSSPVLAFTYDANGNGLTYTDSLGRVTSKTWDKLNRLATETLPPPAQGQSCPETIFGYDNDSRKISENDALNGTTTWAYANADISQVTSETLPAPSGSGQGPTTECFYDPDGRENQVENALDQFTTTTFTPNGQTASVKDNLGDT